MTADRLRAVYRPKGKALEYSELALNVWIGCPHGCLYCFGPRAMHRSPEVFAVPQPKKNLKADLLKDVKVLSGTHKPVLLQFAGDPYPAIEEEARLTRWCLELLTCADVPVTILTKNPRLAQRDFELLKLVSGSSFAVSMVTSKEKTRRYWEPGAGALMERVLALRDAKRRGIRTWVSLEPIVSVAEALEVIACVHAYVDHWKVGMLNYHPHAKTIDWHDAYHRVTKALDELGADYYVKESLRLAGRRGGGQ